MRDGRYITRRRARFEGLSGPENIPFGTEVCAADGYLWRGARLLCALGSQNALDFFSWDGDGRGPERGRLVGAILRQLARRDARYAERWEKVWNDAVCRKYRRREHEDFWLWSEAFYAAPVEDLRHIASLTGAAAG